MLGRVPAHRASHVRADGGAKRDRASRVAIRCDLRAISFDDLSLTAFYRTKGFRLGAGKPIAKQVIRVVDVLLDVVPQAAGECLPTGIEQLGPRVRALEDGVR